MAKLVAGVKSFKSVAIIPMQFSVTKYKASNGRVYDTVIAANKAQQRINHRETSQTLSRILTAAGLTPANNPYIITTHALAKALSNPKFAKALTAVAA